MHPSEEAKQFSIQDQLLRRNVKRFRGGLVFKAHRLLYHSTLGLRVIKKKKKVDPNHTVDLDLFIESQLASTQLTLGPYVVQAWSCDRLGLQMELSSTLNPTPYLISQNVFIH